MEEQMEKNTDIGLAGTEGETVPAADRKTEDFSENSENEKSENVGTGKTDADEKEDLKEKKSEEAPKEEKEPEILWQQSKRVRKRTVLLEGDDVFVPLKGGTAEAEPSEKDTAQDAAQKPGQDAVRKSASHTAQDVARKPGQDAVRKSASHTAQDAARKPGQDAVRKSASHTVQDAVRKPAQNAVRKSAQDADPEFAEGKKREADAAEAKTKIWHRSADEAEKDGRVFSKKSDVRTASERKQTSEASDRTRASGQVSRTHSSEDTIRKTRKAVSSSESSRHADRRNLHNGTVSSQKMKKKELHQKKKKGVPVFRICFTLYIIIFLVFLAVVSRKVWVLMDEYENSQPELTVEACLEQLKSGNMDKVSVEGGNVFENGSDGALQKFAAMVTGADLTYVQDAGSYDTLAPVYDVMLSGKQVAKIYLRADQTYTKMIFLTMSDWEVDSIEGSVEAGTISTQIRVPSAYMVAVNGIALGDEYKVGDPEVLDGFDFVAEYVAAPSYTTYKVSGLSETPVVYIVDDSGEEVAIPEGADVTNLSFDYVTSSTVDETLAAYVLDKVERYSLFFSRDLNGCTESVNPIADMFPAGSYYLEMAENYRKNDMWMFTPHSAAVISNAWVGEYTLYTPDCFTIRASFDKTMVITSTQETRVDHSDQIYYFVLINGSWLIADMKEVL